MQSYKFPSAYFPDHYPESDYYHYAGSPKGTSSPRCCM